LNTMQKEAEQSAGRLKAIAVERVQLQTKIAAALTPDTEKTASQTKLTGLAKEEGELLNRVSEKEAAGKAGSIKITPLQEEAAWLQKQIDAIRAEQKQVVNDWDKKISALNLEMTGNSNKIEETEKTQGAHHRELGEKLAASEAGNEKIDPELTAVRSTQAEMENIGQGIGSLEGQKDDAAVSAYKKMVAILIAGAALITAIIILLIILL
jgi:chromosome segregation ATPase